jgi:hypothetical protein
MKAKKVYEFQQGGNPYDIMGLGAPRVGDSYKSQFNLSYDGVTFVPSQNAIWIYKWELIKIEHINIDHRLSDFADTMIDNSEGLQYDKNLGLIYFRQQNERNYMSYTDLNKYFERV